MSVGKTETPVAGPERPLAWVLHHGTWLASAVIALGLILSIVSGADNDAMGLAGVGERLVRAGIVLFILLPVSRLALMLSLFLRVRDYIFGAISALVLLIIGIGLILALRFPAL